MQNFMLINDSATIAAEVPVYLTNDDIEYFKKRILSMQQLSKVQIYRENKT